MSRPVAVLLAVLALAGCTAAPSSPSTASPSAADPVADVVAMDDAVRHTHPDAFAVVPEATWTQRVDDLRSRIAGLEPDQRVVALARLAGLLDTHTQFYPTSNERLYDAYLYRFPEGLYVVAADDETLVGSRLLAIDGTPVEKIEPQVRQLIPGDNDSARNNNIWVLGYPDYLHGLGVVADKTKATFDVLTPQGQRRSAVVANVDIADFESRHHVDGALAGTSTEAIRRRGEKLWSRLDKTHHAFLLALNDYTEDGVQQALTAMAADLRSGAATHVVVDMRYLRGGDPTPFLPIVSAVAADAHLRSPASLTVLIGRENESAGTVMAEAFDTQTAARMVGEPTPARADNFLCPCSDIPLAASGYTFSVPESRAGNHDTRNAVVPDVVMPMTAADFFAGKDTVLQAAISGTLPR